MLKHKIGYRSLANKYVYTLESYTNNKLFALLGIHETGIRLPELCVYNIAQYLILAQESIYKQLVYEFRIAIHNCYDDDIYNEQNENIYLYG